MASYQPDEIFAPDAPLRALAESGVTPFYLYDEAGIRHSAQQLLRSFASFSDYENYVPIRENPNPALLELLKACDCGVCAGNLTELELAARCGFRGSKLLYEPMVRDPEAAALACQLQARWLVNSTALLPEHSLPRVILRYHINSLDVPNLSRRMNRSRNGMTKEQLFAAAASLHRSGTEEIGLAIQSAAYSLQAGLLARRAKVLHDLAEEVTRQTGAPIRAVYLGDGPGLPYRPKLACPSLEQEAKALEPIFAAWEPQPTVLTGVCKQLLEPHGLMVVKVLEMRRFEQSFLVLDGGFNQYLRPALKQAFRHISVLGQSQVEGRRRYVLSGPTFDERDRLSEGRMLPPVSPGDFCVVHDVGCGGRAMALLYAAQPVAAEYLYTSDGEFRCIGAGRSSREVQAFLYGV